MNLQIHNDVESIQLPNTPLGVIEIFLSSPELAWMKVNPIGLWVDNLHMKKAL